MRRLLLLLAVWLHTAAIQAATYPLMDGRCDEYSKLDVIQHEVGHDVTLYLFQDTNYVWACYDLPNGGWGTVDLVLDTPLLDEPMNLHVSAQLGQWPANKPDLAPQVANSDLWWNNNGWFSNVVSFNGYVDPDAEEKQFKFAPGPGREFQFNKAHFGHGEWQMTFNINSIRTEEGKSVRVTFPKSGVLTLKVN